MSLTNPQIAEHFQELADLLEFGGTNPFRIRAYRNSVRVIEDYPESVADLARNESFELTDIPGIGDCLLYTSPSPRDAIPSRMPSSA